MRIRERFMNSTHGSSLRCILYCCTQRQQTSVQIFTSRKDKTVVITFIRYPSFFHAYTHHRQLHHTARQQMKSTKWPCTVAVVELLCPVLPYIFRSRELGQTELHFDVHIALIQSYLLIVPVPSTVFLPLHGRCTRRSPIACACSTGCMSPGNDAAGTGTRWRKPRSLSASGNWCTTTSMT